MAELNAASPSAEGQKLLQLEVFADKLFGSASPQERDEAQKALVGFSSQVEFIQECKFLLDNSRNNMALLLASSSMLKLLTSFWNSITSEQAMEMKNYIIRYLAVNGQNLPQFVISSLIQVVARVVKLSWLDPHQIWEDRHLEILSQISEFLSSSPAHYVIGLLLYIEIVDEANRHLSIQTIMQHRKIAVAFRDEALLPIFQISITTLQKIISGQFRLDSEAGRKIKSNALKLAFKCLTFDYIGTNSDEASDEFGALQIPSEWRETVEDGSAWTMFMNLARGASEEDNVMVRSLIRTFQPFFQ